MMPGSRKALDLLNDGRFALHSATTDKLHSATTDKQVTQGDAKVSGLAVLVDGEADIARFREAFASSAGAPPPDGPLHLFRADVREMSVVRPGGDHLDIDWWQSDSGVKHVDRK